MTVFVVIYIEYRYLEILNWNLTVWKLYLKRYKFCTMFYYDAREVSMLPRNVLEICILIYKLLSIVVSHTAHSSLRCWRHTKKLIWIYVRFSRMCHWVKRHSQISITVNIYWTQLIWIFSDFNIKEWKLEIRQIFIILSVKIFAIQ